MKMLWTNSRFCYAVGILTFFCGLSIYVHLMEDATMLRMKTKLKNYFTQDVANDVPFDSHQFKSMLLHGDWMTASNPDYKSILQFKNASQNTNRAEAKSDARLSQVTEKKVKRLPQALGIGAKKCGTGISFQSFQTWAQFCH